MIKDVVRVCMAAVEANVGPNATPEQNTAELRRLMVEAQSARRIRRLIKHVSEVRS